MKIQIREMWKTLCSVVGKSRAQRVFREVYQKNLWGGVRGEFYSGGGSDSVNTGRYVDMLRSFLDDNKIRSVVEIGCGDFRVAGQIEWAKKNISYTGLDVVPELIERNRKEHASQYVRFECLNAITTDPPNGDLVLIRYVLQHLSNDDVQSIIRRIRRFKFALITDGQPHGHPVPDRLVNRDKKTDQFTRVDLYGTGLYLEAPPFNCDVEVVLQFPVAGGGEEQRTVLLRPERSRK